MLILITTIHFIELPEHAYNTLTYKLCFLCHQTIFIYYTVLNISNPKIVAQSPKNKHQQPIYFQRESVQNNAIFRVVGKYQFSGLLRFFQKKSHIRFNF